MAPCEVIRKGDPFHILLGNFTNCLKGVQLFAKWLSSPKSLKLGGKKLSGADEDQNPAQLYFYANVKRRICMMHLQLCG